MRGSKSLYLFSLSFLEKCKQRITRCSFPHFVQSSEFEVKLPSVRSLFQCTFQSREKLPLASARRTFGMISSEAASSPRLPLLFFFIILLICFLKTNLPSDSSLSLAFHGWQPWQVYREQSSRRISDVSRGNGK